MYPWLRVCTVVACPQAVTALTDLFGKFDAGDKGHLSAPEVRTLAASIELVTTAARDSLKNAIKLVDDPDEAHRESKGAKSSSSPRRRGPRRAVRGSGVPRPPSATVRPATAGRRRRRTGGGRDVVMSPGSTLPLTRFLAYAATMVSVGDVWCACVPGVGRQADSPPLPLGCSRAQAADQPYMLCQLMQSYGYGMSLEPNRASKVSDDVAMDVGLPPKPKGITGRRCASVAAPPMSRYQRYTTPAALICITPVSRAFVSGGALAWLLQLDPASRTGCC